MRTLAMMVTALVVVVFACGDDASDPPRDAASRDAPTGMDAPPSGQIGAACDEDTDCMFPEARCVTTSTAGKWLTWPAGYCTVSCGTLGDMCNSDARCAPLPGHGQHCLDICATDADCRTGDGYSCREHFYDMNLYCLPVVDAGT